MARRRGRTVSTTTQKEVSGASKSAPLMMVSPANGAGDVDKTPNLHSARHIEEFSNQLTRVLEPGASQDGISMDSSGWVPLGDLVKCRHFKSMTAADVMMYARLANSSTSRFELWDGTLAGGEAYLRLIRSDSSDYIEVPALQCEAEVSSCPDHVGSLTPTTSTSSCASLVARRLSYFSVANTSSSTVNSENGSSEASIEDDLIASSTSVDAKSRLACMKRASNFICGADAPAIGDVVLPHALDSTTWTDAAEECCHYNYASSNHVQECFNGFAQQHALQLMSFSEDMSDIADLTSAFERQKLNVHAKEFVPGRCGTVSAARLAAVPLSSETVSPWHCPSPVECSTASAARLAESPHSCETAAPWHCPSPVACSTASAARIAASPSSSKAATPWHCPSPVECSTAYAESPSESPHFAPWHCPSPVECSTASAARLAASLHSSETVTPPSPVERSTASAARLEALQPSSEKSMPQALPPPVERSETALCNSQRSADVTPTPLPADCSAAALRASQRKAGLALLRAASHEQRKEKTTSQKQRTVASPTNLARSEQEPSLRAQSREQPTEAVPTVAAALEDRVARPPAELLAAPASEELVARSAGAAPTAAPEAAVARPAATAPSLGGPTAANPASKNESRSSRRRAAKMAARARAGAEAASTPTPPAVLDGATARRCWAAMSIEDRKAVLRFEEPRLVKRAYDVNQELTLSELQCWGLGVDLTRRRDGSAEAMDVALGFTFAFRDDLRRSALGEASGQPKRREVQALVVKDFLCYSEVMLRLIEEEFGNLFANERMGRRRSEWYRIFEDTARSWAVYKRQLLRLAELAIFEALSAAAPQLDDAESKAAARQPDDAQRAPGEKLSELLVGLLLGDDIGGGDGNVGGNEKQQKRFDAWDPLLEQVLGLKALPQSPSTTLLPSSSYMDASAPPSTLAASRASKKQRPSDASAQKELSASKKASSKLRPLAVSAPIEPSAPTAPTETTTARLEAAIDAEARAIRALSLAVAAAGGTERLEANANVVGDEVADDVVADEADSETEGEAIDSDAFDEVADAAVADKVDSETEGEAVDSVDDVAHVSVAENADDETAGKRSVRAGAADVALSALVAAAKPPVLPALPPPASRPVTRRATAAAAPIVAAVPRLTAVPRREVTVAKLAVSQVALPVPAGERRTQKCVGASTASAEPVLSQAALPELSVDASAAAVRTLASSAARLQAWQPNGAAGDEQTWRWCGDDRGRGDSMDGADEGGDMLVVVRNTFLDLEAQRRPQKRSASASFIASF